MNIYTGQIVTQKIKIDQATKLKHNMKYNGHNNNNKKYDNHVGRFENSDRPREITGTSVRHQQ